MSSQQAQLTDAWDAPSVDDTDTDDDNYDRRVELGSSPYCRDTTPDTDTGDTMQDDGRQCRNCGNHVTEQFVRVFGPENDAPDGCLDCRTMRELQQGVAAGADNDYGYGGRS